MNYQELHNLQKAYNNVYIEEVSDKTKQKFKIMKMKEKIQPPYSSDWNKKISQLVLATSPYLEKLRHNGVASGNMKGLYQIVAAV